MSYTPTLTYHYCIKCGDVTETGNSNDPRPCSLCGAKSLRMDAVMLPVAQQLYRLGFDFTLIDCVVYHTLPDGGHVGVGVNSSVSGLNVWVFFNKNYDVSLFAGLHPAFGYDNGQIRFEGDTFIHDSIVAGTLTCKEEAKRRVVQVLLDWAESAELEGLCAVLTLLGDF